MSFKSIITHISREGEEYIINLSNVQMLPHYFDPFLIGNLQDSQNKILSLIDEVAKNLKKTVKKKTINTNELDITISFLTYLVLFRIPAQNNLIIIDYKKLSNSVTSLLMLSKNRDFSPQTTKIIIDGLKALCSYNTDSLKYVYDAIYHFINSSDIEMQNMILDVFSSLSQIPSLLMIIHTKKHTNNIRVIKFIKALIFKLINGCNISIQPSDDKELQDICAFLAEQNDEAFHEVRAFLMFLFLPHHSHLMSLQDYLYIINSNPQYFLLTATTEHIEDLCSFMSNSGQIADIGEGFHQAFVHVLICILNNRPDIFIEIFNSLKSMEIIEGCIPELIKEIITQKQIEVDNTESQESTENNLNEESEAEHTEKEDCELEDLDKSINPSKNGCISGKIIEIVVEKSLQLLFNENPSELQFMIYDCICSSSEFFGTVVLNVMKLLKNRNTNDEVKSDDCPTKVMAIDFLAETLLDISKKYLQSNFCIFPQIPEVYVFLSKQRLINKSDDDNLEDNVHIYGFLNFLALVSLTEREHCDESFKSLGYKEENIEEAFLSLTSGGACEWRNEAQDQMYKSFANLVSILRDLDGPEKDLNCKKLKTAFVGCIALLPTIKLESLVTLLSLVDSQSADEISGAFNFINISRMSEMASLMFRKLFEPWKSEAADNIRGFVSLIISLLQNNKWNKERMIDANLKTYVQCIIQEISTGNEYSNFYNKILVQILIADKDNGIDIGLKGKAVRVLLENLKLSEFYQSDVIKAIITTYNDPQSEFTEQPNKIEELALVPNIFNFIEKFVSNEATINNDELVETISSICCIYESAFELAFNKIKSSNQMIANTYTHALVRFFEKIQKISLKDSFSILDFFMMDQSIIVNGIANGKCLSGFTEVICEHIYSSELAKDLFSKLAQIHFKYFEKETPGDNEQNITTLRNSKITDMIISYYCRLTVKQWVENYCEIDSSICQRIANADKSENIMEFVRTFLDQFEEFVDTVPPEPLKVAYYMSSFARSEYIKRVIFQSLIIFHAMNYDISRNSSISIHTIGNLIARSATPSRCNSSLIQNIINNKKLPQYFKFSDEDYLNLTGKLVKTSFLLYDKGRKLYEDDGLNNIWYNKSAPKLDTGELFKMMCLILPQLVAQKPVDEDDKIAIDQFIFKLFQFSIQYHHSFPEEWNDIIDLKEICECSNFFKQSITEAEITNQFMAHTVEEKKWYFVSYVMIAMSTHNNKNNDIYSKLLSLIIKRFEIECTYQIPILCEGFSGRLDSLALQISKGLAECNGNSACIFLQQYFNALKEFNGQYELSSLIVLQPWSIAAGKKKNSQYVNNLIDAFLDLFPSLTKELVWAKSGSILVDNLFCYSKASDVLTNEVLVEVLAQVCQVCKAEDERKVILMSKILIMNLEVSEEEPKDIYPSLIHSCIIGIAIYGASSLRSLLHLSLNKLAWINHEIDFIEDLSIKAYDCLLRIACLLSERRDLLKDNIVFFEKVFFDDAIKAPCDQISIIGWLFLAAFTQFDKLPTKEYKVEADYYKSYKSKEQQTEENRKFEYDREEVEDIVNNHTKPYSIINKLLRFNMSNPKEFSDILSLYIRRINNINVTQSSNNIIDFNGDLGNYNSTILICFASINIIKFVPFEAKTMRELFEGDSTDETWNDKALSFFAYLVLSRSENLERFISTLNKSDKLVQLIMKLSNGLNIADINVEPELLHELVAEFSKKEALESVVNNLIQFAGDDESTLRKVSAEILPIIFSESEIWMQSKKVFPNVLWNVYSNVQKQEKAETFVNSIQAILDWNISRDATLYFYEALTILEQITSKLSMGTIEKLAVQCNVFDESEQRLDFDKILSCISDSSLEEIMGAVFVFGKDRVNDDNQNTFKDLLSKWIETNIECLPTISAVFNEPLSVLNLDINKIPNDFKLEVISSMIQTESLSESDADLIIKSADVWIAEQSIIQWSKMIVHLMKSKYLDQINCTSLFSKIIVNIISLITKQGTIEGIKSTIKDNATKIKQIIAAQENEDIDNLVTSIIEGNNIFKDAEALTSLLANWKVKNKEAVDEIADEIEACIEKYNHHIELAPIIGELCHSLEAMVLNIELCNPKTLCDEQFARNLVSQVMNFLIITETELPGFKCRATYQVLKQLVKVNPDFVLPLVYAYPGVIPEKMRESVSIVSALFINSKLNPCEPVLSKLLEENFAKLFDSNFSIEELIDIISYLALTQRFDKFFEYANERLIENQDLSDDSKIAKVFTALFCFLIRPLQFDKGVLESLNERNINDVLHQIYLSENFYYYFNKLSIDNVVKKNLFLECILKQFLKSPELFRTEPKLTGYTYSTLVFSNLTEIDNFIESISHKNPLCAIISYKKKIESREKVIPIIDNKILSEPLYPHVNEKEQLLIDFRISSEFNIFTRIIDNPISCLSIYQRQCKFLDPVVACINMPSIRYLLDYDRYSLWKFANSIQNESEAMKLIFILTEVYLPPKKVRELISFIIVRYPKAAAQALIENVMDSAFTRNIPTYQVMSKGREEHDVHTMRCIRILYELAQVFPGLFSDHGPKLVANCICSLSIASFKWVKSVRGLISQYVDHIDLTNEIINEKKEALMKAIDEKERHFDVIVEAAFDLFGAIGEEKQSEFVSIFNSVSIFDFKYLYPMGVSAHIKLCELGAISDDALKVPSEIDKTIRSIVRNFMCYFQNDDGSWTCYLTGVFETIEKLVSLKCSAKHTKLMAWLSIVCIMSNEKIIRMASLSLLRTCISSLAADNEIIGDEFLSSCISTANMISLNKTLHQLLTHEYDRNFVSIFAVCVSVAFGYGDEETMEAVNCLLKDAWSVWNQRAIASLYILLPMVGYSSLDVKEVTGMDFVPLLDTIVPSLRDVDLMFIRAYDRCAAKDWRCSRERLAILCPNLSFPLKKAKNYGPRKETVRVVMPQPEKSIYYFSLINRAIINEYHV